ncbi:MAG: hypothetical protein KatS3mg110_4282 [Pirellulaceae bacterium]|nr:MAG: hypothetical protein KatS3mg110_4282 [Pirellulaceae bacterium]
MSSKLQELGTLLLIVASAFFTIHVCLMSDISLGQDPIDEPVAQPPVGGGGGGNCGGRCDAGFGQGVSCCAWLGPFSQCGNDINLPQCVGNPNAPCSNPTPPPGWTCIGCTCRRIGQTTSCECQG